MNKMLRKVVSCMAVMAVLLTVTIPALAVTSTSSPKKYVTLLGYTYEYNSHLYVNDTAAWGYLSVYASDNVPVGYIGTNSCLYNSSGALVKSSGWIYSDSSIAGCSMPSGSCYQPGTYYAKGQVRFYNGNGYNTYTTNSTPYLTLRSYSAQIGVNDAGLTYGSDMLATSEDAIPDLILAVGTNGAEGYVYSTDLYEEAPDYNEATNTMSNTSCSHYIPLYEEDGETVIGMFEIRYDEATVYVD